MPKTKPKKPRKNFPLFPHANGQWAKKIRGKLHYFGPWQAPREAEAKYLDSREYLQAGRRPPDTTPDDGCRLRDLCNAFLTSKQSLLDAGEIRRITFQDYRRCCNQLLKFLGPDTLVSDLKAADFEKYRIHMGKSRAMVALGNEINRTRIIFKYAYDSDLIDRPVKFGQTFRQPSKKALRIHRQKRQQEHGKRMFTATEIRCILKEATLPMQAFVYLGINGALGASEISEMPHASLDLANGWLDYPRPKTGVERRIPLWPETIKALKESIAKRTDESLVFITRARNPYVRVSDNGVVRNSIMEEFSKLITRLKIKRLGLGFYALRHTFETIAGESKDQVAVDAVMGHADQSMAAAYREQISNERLVDVSNFVRDWVVATASKKIPKE